MQYEVVVTTLLDNFSISPQCLMPVGRILENLVCLPSGDIQIENSDPFCTYCKDDDCPIIKFMPSDKRSVPVKGSINVVLNVGKLPMNMLEIQQNCPLTPDVFINKGGLELANNEGIDEIIDPRIEDPENIRRFPAESLLLESNFVFMNPEDRGKCVFCNLDCALNPGYEAPKGTQDKENKSQRDFTNQ